MLQSPEAAATNPAPPPWPRHVLQADGVWLLNPPRGERFDASGLELLPEQGLVTVNDRGARLYRIVFRPDSTEADLVEIPDWYTPSQLAPFAREKLGRYDSEGVAHDLQGRVYLCEEGDRWVLRLDPGAATVERLPIDWRPVERFFSADRNASWEGIAVDGERLYLVNERQQGRIIVIDLPSLRVVDDFVAGPRGNHAADFHYSGLDCHSGSLFVLLRFSQLILEVDPLTKRVVAEYDYAAMERDPEYAYRSWLPTGWMEGIAVDDEFIWLVTDNNGQGRRRDARDTRPTLFRCRRP